MTAVFTADSTGQKAHFQVEDKSGDLKISATKDLAKVTAQADSVQVVVKPGTAEYPVLKSDKPIVHVTQPGWHTISFRKSAIFKTLGQVGKLHDSKARRASKKIMAHSKSLHGFKLGQRRRKVFFKKGSSSSPQLTPKTEISNLSHFSRDKQGDLRGSKKSDVSGFHVKGNAGKIKMHVTKDETTLSSESGGIDVSLNKRPSASSSSTTSKSSQRSFQALPQWFREESGDKTIHVASEIQGNMPYLGLRKSVVTKLDDDKTDWD